jgi:hypothetical protein
MIKKFVFSLSWFPAALVSCLLALRLSAGTLTGSFSPIASGSNVNLSAVGKIDWVHWGLATEASLNRKSCEAIQIGNFIGVRDTNNIAGFVQVYQLSDNANGYTWRDGQPVNSVTNSTTGVWAYGIPALGTGFEISVPADATQRVVQVFVGVFSGRGMLEASLSDGSATVYSDASLANLFGNGPGGVYTLNYSANSTGQSLKIRWTLSQAAGPNAASANVTLQAAALTATSANNPPFATLTSPGRNATFLEHTNITLTATAQDFDGTVTNVAFYVGSTFLGALAAPPFTVTWSNVQRGRYILTAYAYDNAGAISCPQPVEVFVYGTGGSQTNSVSAAQSTADLTAAGTADWTHWGLFTNSSFDYKGLVSRKISNYTLIGSVTPLRYADNFTSFSWSDGVPTPTSGGTPTGLFVTGVGNGFQLTAPADTQTRTLRLYVGGYAVEAEFQAYLSDLSAKPFADNSVSNYYDSSYAVYTIDYTAASFGQHLNVIYRSRNLFDQTYGNVTLQSATLAGGLPEALPISIVEPKRVGSDFILSFTTQTGFTYSVEYTDTLPGPNWNWLATEPGSGSLVSITNFNVPPGKRFYRVRTP